MTEPLDVVYTWVDDRWPGYLERLRAYARKDHDLNPNRTRDNLELLRYSLRSLARYAPWVRNVHLFTCRPQAPHWLDTAHPRLRIIHHDEVIDAALLPSFSSFAIVAHIARLSGLPERFVYFEDDMLLGAPVAPDDFFCGDGRPRLLRRLGRTPAASRRDDEHTSPWNAALARANGLLDERFGRAARWVYHFPLPLERTLWDEMLAAWPRELQHTRASRFRSVGDVPPEYLYVHYARGRGRAMVRALGRSYREALYFPLENRLAQMRMQRLAAALLRPKFITMNDNFDARPDPAVVAYMRALLEAWFPEPSPFEKRADNAPS